MFTKSLQKSRNILLGLCLSVQPFLSNAQEVKGLTVHESKDSKPAQLNFRENNLESAPNIVLVLLDDVGYAQMGHMGGQINTPAFDQIADDGLTYTRFHTTALCSPTRAALLTGRNHHEAETGAIMEIGTGNDGYTMMLPKEVGSFARVLQQEGYSTSWFGKNHNVPDWEASITGPFDRWPNDLGFDYFYGFLGGDTDQFHPALVENRSRIEAPSTNVDGSRYHLTHDMADKAINYVQSVNAIAPDKPFFVYFSPGATHAPHQAPADYIKKYKGKFDAGWDVYREVAFDNMKQKGIIPADTELTPRPASLPAWESLTSEQKKVYANMMEVFAAFTEHTDTQVKRLRDSIEEMGKLDNTIFVYIAGDNGASAEGGVEGLLNEMAFFNGIPEKWEDKVEAVESGRLGSEDYFNHMPAAWAWAVNSPYQWTKQVASHLGGVRNAMTISYPNGIKSRGEVRTQFTHVTDIAPTLLEVAGIEMPEEIDGAPQKPIDGESLVATFNNENALEEHTTQYFEILGNLGIYHDGWWAGAMRNVPWTSMSSDAIEITDMEWELYNLNDDFSQAKNLAKENPAKLEYMKYMFFAEAGKANALPIDDRRTERFRSSFRPSLTTGLTAFKYPNGLRIPEGATPFTKFQSYELKANLDGYKKGNQGVLITQGGRFGGFALRVDKAGYVYYEYCNAVDKYSIKSSIKVPSGTKQIEAKVIMDEKKPYTPATIYLSFDGKKAGNGRIEKTLPNLYSLDETLDIGRDSGTAVTENYNVKNSKYTGILNNVELNLIDSYKNSDLSK
ncbi:arylsulfatase [Flammeovirga kamogawensis]|uniref:Arylsulfatase n=1 Tax=Flammeovirga kamogawensis TaxID=373891 RepID=A0ABX8H3K7_9BACT|nr:arylsulfatase [Flammeovirga kamogawensis]MBB6460175.1 arylsulfatase [Flammeovirga kamogawensis]QWG09987.1 arylsulfatase [Flammeovirga kamogawensis]TRX65495.1 arylsulfatase [Flammeovirga kamogawensis]